MNAQLLEQARRLSIDEQLELIEALWDSIAEGPSGPPITEAQKKELDRRIADHDANPDDVVPWDEVKESVLARLGR